jgi:anthranilate synthase component 1
MITPSLSEFIRLSKRHNLVPLRREIIVDRVTPVSVYERLQEGESHAFLLESVEGGERFGRYSFVGRRPRATFVCQEDKITYQEGASERRWTTQNPLKDLKAIFAGIVPAELPGLPRFWGGAVGYWNYDTVRFFERLPAGRSDTLGLPTAAFHLSGEVVVFDRFSQLAQVIANVYIPRHKQNVKDLKALYAQGVRSIEQQVTRIESHQTPKRAKRLMPPKAPRPLMTRKAYEDAVIRAKEYIRAGDIIQVVLSQRWMIESPPPPFEVYRALRMVNPSPYMYCLHFPQLDVVGSSPELLVRKEHDLAETRPIAGTRRRGDSADEDERLTEELRQDPKERAEHLMLVDLGRNDLGRVCGPGSVKVPQLMTIEYFSHVMHLVSSVTGRLKPDANAFDLLQACFPAGTVSGAPKIRAMEIIDELETVRRGPYAGSVGYFSYTGNMDMAITIRTLFFHKGKAYMQSGGGIVADSVPSHEYQESLHKAAALFAAVQKARELL